MRKVVLLILGLAGCSDSAPTHARAPTTAPSPKEPPIKPVVVSHEVAETGRESIKGKVRLAGKVPHKPPPAPNAYVGHELGNVTCEQWCVGRDEALANVFIMIQSCKVTSTDPPVEPIMIVQWCSFWQPRVAGVRVGQPLIVRNGENRQHNLHFERKYGLPFNRGLAKQGATETLQFTGTEKCVMLRCDIHPWEVAWVHVVDHPFWAVTGIDGEFEIKELPAGEYELVAWHERFLNAPIVTKVGIEAKKSVIVDFTFEVTRR